MKQDIPMHNKILIKKIFDEFVKAGSATHAAKNIVSEYTKRPMTPGGVRSLLKNIGYKVVFVPELRDLDNNKIDMETFLCKSLSGNH